MWKKLRRLPLSAQGRGGVPWGWGGGGSASPPNQGPGRGWGRSPGPESLCCFHIWGAWQGVTRAGMLVPDTWCLKKLLELRYGPTVCNRQSRRMQTGLGCPCRVNLCLPNLASLLKAARRPLSSSFLGLPYRSLNMNHKEGTT